MSTLRAIHDEANTVEEILLYEKDPIERLRAVAAAHKRFIGMFRTIEREAAYEARFSLSGKDIAELLDVDRRQIDYLVSCYLRDNPYKEPPPHHNRSRIDEYVDLSQGNDHHSRLADTRTDQS
jgi:hypothetical protein